MRLASLGMLLIVAGLVLLVTVPFMIAATAPPRPIDTGGLACVYIFLVPVCFSVGMQPAFAAVLAALMLAIFVMFAYVAYRVFRTAVRTEGY